MPARMAAGESQDRGDKDYGFCHVTILTTASASAPAQIHGASTAIVPKATRLKEKSHQASGGQVLCIGVDTAPFAGKSAAHNPTTRSQSASLIDVKNSVGLARAINS